MTIETIKQVRYETRKRQHTSACIQGKDTDKPCKDAPFLDDSTHIIIRISRTTTEPHSIIQATFEPALILLLDLCDSRSELLLMRQRRRGVGR